MKQAIEAYIKMWEDRCYQNGIPDEVPPRLAQLHKAPSYKQICLAILKNDYALKTLGFEPKKSKYYHALKKIELKEREENKNKPKEDPKIIKVPTLFD